MRASIARAHPARIAGKTPGVSLAAVVKKITAVPRVRRHELRFADRMVVWTQNSEYDLLVIGADEYLVTGGWFDREQLSPSRVRINGCTWGGSMIVTDTVAAPGMCIEFSNRVITSPIRRVIVCRPGTVSPVNNSV